MKKTPWFPAHVDPSRPGVYEKKNTSTGQVFFARYDKHPEMPGLPFGVWFVGSIDYNYALNEDTPVPFAFRKWPWRGLAEDPNA
jgi:hypothetical protein